MPKGQPLPKVGESAACRSALRAERMLPLALTRAPRAAAGARGKAGAEDPPAAPAAARARAPRARVPAPDESRPVPAKTSCANAPAGADGGRKRAKHRDSAGAARPAAPAAEPARAAAPAASPAAPQAAAASAGAGAPASASRSSNSRVRRTGGAAGGAAAVAPAAAQVPAHEERPEEPLGDSPAANPPPKKGRGKAPTKGPQRAVYFSVTGTPTAKKGLKMAKPAQLLMIQTGVALCEGADGIFAKWYAEGVVAEAHVSSEMGKTSEEAHYQMWLKFLTNHVPCKIDPKDVAAARHEVGLMTGSVWHRGR